MTNYLLTIIGDIESEKMCKEIALSISPLVDSKNLKFLHKKGVLLMHFATDSSKGEIYDYIYGILYGVIDTFILTEITDEVSVSMPKEMFGHLFDLENVDDDVTMRLEMGKIITNQMKYIDDNYEFDEEEISMIIDEFKPLMEKPSLDQILDKVLSNGMGSLTQYEKDILETYSK